MIFCCSFKSFVKKNRDGTLEQGIFLRVGIFSQGSCWRSGWMIKITPFLFFIFSYFIYYLEKEEKKKKRKERKKRKKEKKKRKRKKEKEKKKKKPLNHQS